MASELDLQGLAVRRTAETPVPRRRSKWLARYALPGVVLAGFAAVLAWAARDSFLPCHAVTVAPVVVQRGSAQRAGTPLFQAAGWVEPRPTPTLVTALAEGVVDKLLVVEGQSVAEGEPVARLIDVDAKLAVREAEARLEMARAEAKRADAELQAAQIRRDEPAHLEAAVAEAEAELAKVERELADHAYDIRADQAKLKLARQVLENRLGAEGSIPETMIQEARASVDTTAADLEQHTARVPKLEQEAKALRAKAAAVRRLAELKTDETRMVAQSESAQRAAAAKVREAETALDAAQLRLARMVVRAPLAGRVLALVARPGTRVMGLAQASFEDASTVVTLYEPERLQVRADVLLDDVPRVRPGQPVRIETPAAGKPLEGEVLFATSTADIQKNTLQVKVAVKSPPPLVKPEMLVRVTFLAPAVAAPSGGEQPWRMLVPRSLVGGGEGGSYVWLADRAAGVCRRCPVKLGPLADGELVEVVEGLNVADKLIAGGRESLSEGARIEVTGEEPSLGLAAAPLAAPRSDLQRLAPGKTGESK